MGSMLTSTIQAFEPPPPPEPELTKKRKREATLRLVMCKRAKSQGHEIEAAFFASLLPYERSRWLYAMCGLWALLEQCDTIRIILIDMMYVSCLERQCNRIVPPLTERIYDTDTHGSALCEAMTRERRNLVNNKVQGERDALIARGVPLERIGLICANDNPRDGLGGLYSYDGGDALKRLDHEDTMLVFPLNFVYVCVDMDDRETIYQYINKHYFK